MVIQSFTKSLLLTFFCFAGASTAKLSAKMATKIRSFSMEKMEDLLFNWIQDQDQRNIPISLAETKSKAISIYEMT